MASDGTTTDEETLTVTVNEVNVVPVLAAIADRTVAEGATLAFTALVTDSDLPAQALAYSLVDAPAGVYMLEVRIGPFARRYKLAKAH